MTPPKTFAERAARQRERAKKAKARGEARAAVAPPHQHGEKQRWCIHCGDLGMVYEVGCKHAATAGPERPPEPVHVSTERRRGPGAPEKRGVLDSPTLRKWIAKGVTCTLMGAGYCRCEPGRPRPSDPHHVATRGAHGRQDVLVVALCREAHDAAHAGHIPAVEVEAAAYRTQRAFWLRAPAAVRRKALQEMMEGLP